MRPFSALLLLTAVSAFAQAPTVANAAAAAAAAPAVKPETVVATINGKSYTAGEIDAIVKAMPQSQRANFQRQPKTFLEQYSQMQTILLDAEKEKLAEKPPYKDQIAELENQLKFLRMQVLMNGAVNEYSQKVPVTTDAMRAIYDKNPEKYREAKAKVIYIPFSNTPSLGATRPIMKEDEARSKAEQIASQARAGADFVKLVKENSFDKDSLARDGDFGMAIRSTSERVPAQVRNAVLSAKQGDITDPIKTANGFYIFRIESIGVAPFESLQNELWKEVQNAAVAKWLAELRSQTTVKIESEDYFKR